MKTWIKYLRRPEFFLFSLLLLAVVAEFLMHEHVEGAQLPKVLVALAMLYSFGLLLWTFQSRTRQTLDVEIVAEEPPCVLCYDAMTGLYTHRKINELLEEAVQRAEQADRPLTVLYLDVDDLRPINEHYGYETGDLALQHVVAQLQASVGPDDLLGRFGGDEFVIVLPDTTCQEAEQVSLAIQHRLREQRFFASQYEEALPVTISVGMASYPQDARRVKFLLSVAEAAKDRAKHDGVAKIQRRGNYIRTEVLIANASRALEMYYHSLKDKDTYTLDHSEDVADYAMLIAEALGLPECEQQELRIAGLFHDIGKVLIPDPILKKPGRLTDQEYLSMQDHVTISHEILNDHYTSEIMKDGVLYHHERFDGKGYPFGMSGEDIPLAGRIVAIADSFSAMTLDRSYRRSKTVEEGLAEIRRCAGTQFDPMLAAVFCEAIEQRRLELEQQYVS